MTLKNFAARGVTTFMLAIFLAVALTLVSVGHVFAEQLPGTGNPVDSRSPADDISVNTNSWHNLILSQRFGMVQEIEAGVYFKKDTPTAGRTISFKTDPSDARCKIEGIRRYPLKNNDYVLVKIGEGTHVEREYIDGDKICSTAPGDPGSPEGRTIRIPRGALTDTQSRPAGFKDSGRMGAKIEVRWVNGEEAYEGVRGDLAAHNQGAGHSFRFRLRTDKLENEPNSKRGVIGFINTRASAVNSPNNTLVFEGGHKGTGREYNQIFYTFGLSCSVEDPLFRQSVSLYDVDNGVSGVQDIEARFYVGVVDETRNVTPLKIGDYLGEGNGAATRLNDILFEESEGGDRKNIDLDRRILHNNGTPNNPNDDYPQFVPSNFHNKGGETKIKIHEMRPFTHYVLIVDMVHQGQYIYSGLPGDALFGSPEYDYAAECPDTPDAPTLQPFVSLSKSEYEIGEAPTANAWIDKRGRKNVSIDTNRQFWYETSATWDQSTRRQGGETMIHQVDPNHWDINDSELHLPRWTAGQFPDPGPGGRIPNPAVPANARYVCTLLELKNPSLPLTTLETPNPAVSCAILKRRPHFKVTHGDVNAAAAWGRPCTANGKISAFNLGPSEGYKGSGTQAAAFSVGVINQFTSGIPAKGLTFANTTSDDYGGGFDGATQAYCIEDYLSGVTNNRVETIDGSPDEAAVIKTQNNAIITGSRRVTNVTVGNVPALQWVIADNIYIDAGVTELHGIYIARNNIFTCSNGANPVNVVQNQAQFNRCNQPLTIKGALVAGGLVKLQRTNGSLVGPTPAEIIEYNPFVWLSAINGQGPPGGGGTANKFDYVTALPPIL